VPVLAAANIRHIFHLTTTFFAFFLGFFFGRFKGLNLWWLWPEKKPETHGPASRRTGNRGAPLAKHGGGAVVPWAFARTVT
ncbi:hypothetical protein, partial [Hwangdonia sp.]|uniref:hypothetical protein n=1 Tax=Hwangdonia sp. TaxID=1883432 RepID=UPI003AB7F87D